MIKILLVEDEPAISSFVRMDLIFEGYDVQLATDGQEALTMFYETQPDLILLDYMLPKLDGLGVLRRIRKTSNVPIIFLTAKSYIGDKVSVLDAGGNDYLTKPFEIEELLVRVRVQLRQKSLVKKNMMEISNLVMDVEHHKVMRSGKTIDLTQREFSLLKFLFENQGQAVAREAIFDAVWGEDFLGQDNTIDTYIRYLRQKIDKNFEPKLIHTVRGFGYVMEVVK